MKKQNLLLMLSLCCVSVVFAENAPLLSSPTQPVTLSPQTEAISTEVILAGDDYLTWDKRPLPIGLPVGKERLISFPSSVEFTNTDPNLTPDVLRVMNNAGTLYLKALKPFDTTRVEVRLTSTGQVILLDLSADDAEEDTSIDILLSDQATSTHQDTSEPSTSQNFLESPIPLLRYAIQQLYAPARLLVESPRIVRVPMNTDRNVVLFYGAATMAYPLVSWRSGGTYVTAVILQNTLKRKLVLDPRHIQGAWQAISFYPRNQLMPRGTTQDQTTVFLVSNEPFSEALVTVPREGV